MGFELVNLLIYMSVLVPHEEVLFLLLCVLNGCPNVEEQFRMQEVCMVVLERNLYLHHKDNSAKSLSIFTTVYAKLATNLSVNASKSIFTA